MTKVRVSAGGAESNLEPLGRPHGITRVFISERVGQDSQRRRHEAERDHEPRKAGSLYKILAKARDQAHPRASRKP